MEVIFARVMLLLFMESAVHASDEMRAIRRLRELLLQEWQRALDLRDAQVN